ncbi:ABC transporter permease [Aeromicrobium alkaliterrae]|uniref:ABC transmembrane type-1 domain-containing protein n=1 Tax=Aeromicrobium alkaliterrae TaxID=302168 RepID=A0ABP4VPL0_9ACTN
MTITSPAPTPIPAIDTHGAADPRRARRRRGVSAVAWRLLGIVGALGLWQLGAVLVDSRGVLPGPAIVFSELGASLLDDPGLRYLGVQHPGYLYNIGWTVGFAVVAWLVGSALGAAVGLISARVQLVRNVSEPLLFVFGAVPALVLAPFFLVWFGQGWAGKAVLVAFYSFVTVGLVAQSAALSFPRASEEYAATLGLDTRSRFRHVVVPGTLPAILAGLRIALATAIAVQATVELLGSQTGVGRLIALRANQGDVAAVLGLSLALGLSAMALDLLLRVVIRRIIRWQ